MAGYAPDVETQVMADTGHWLTEERPPEHAEAWERAYDAVQAAVVLRYPGGGDVPEFLLHVDGDEAWWRWNDEVFHDD